MEEVFQLKTKGFAFWDIGLGEGKSGSGMRSACVRRLRGSGHDRCRSGWRTRSDRGCDDGWVDADGQEFLAGEVE